MTEPTPEDEGYRDAVAAVEAAQNRVGALAKDDPQREQAKVELDAAVSRQRDAKAAVKQATARRNFAGINSPLHDAIVARVDPSLDAEVEVEALAILAQREEKNRIERDAKRVKNAKKVENDPPKTAPQQKPTPEVVVVARRPRAAALRHS